MKHSIPAQQKDKCHVPVCFFLSGLFTSFYMVAQPRRHNLSRFLIHLLQYLSTQTCTPKWSELAQAHPSPISYLLSGTKAVKTTFGMYAISKLVYTQLGNLIITSLLVMICNSNNYPSKAIMIMHALHSSHRFFTTNLALFKKKKLPTLQIFQSINWQPTSSQKTGGQNGFKSHDGPTGIHKSRDNLNKQDSA